VGLGGLSEMQNNFGKMWGLGGICEMPLGNRGISHIPPTPPSEIKHEWYVCMY
jgi:hypothetical protein